MVKKKKTVKKVSKMKNSCDENGYPKGIGLMKLSSMAFILFFVTVSPAFMEFVSKIHWGWFLGAAIVFGSVGYRKCCSC